MTTPEFAPVAALEPKTKLSGKVLKTTLAGALVDIGQSLPGVIHISQLSEDAVNKVEDVVKEGQVVDVWAPSQEGSHRADNGPTPGARVEGNRARHGCER